MGRVTNYDEKYCDFCRSTLGDEYVDRGHQEWCPLVEIERLRAALRRIAESPEADTILVLPEGDTVWKFAKEAVEEGSDE